jgi:uncharacterized protein (UPF0335 family)
MRELTAGERRRLHRATERIERLEADLGQVRREWADLVEELSQAAVGRELGLSRQAIAARVKVIRKAQRGFRTT